MSKVHHLHSINTPTPSLHKSQNLHSQKPTPNKARIDHLTINRQNKSMCNEKISPSPHLYITLKAPPPPPLKQSLITEARSLFSLSFPIALTALLFYSRSIISMLFLGSLGDLPLAAGSLAIAFANITGYSILSGLSLGMEPLCSQAFGANQSKLLSLTLHRSVLFLLCSSFPISLLWLNMSRILIFLGQDKEITLLAHSYLCYSIPDLFSYSFIHPIRIYLRSQGITKPLTSSAAVSTLLHLPLNYIFVSHFHYGPEGVAAASSISNILLLFFLLLLCFRAQQTGPSKECLTGWGPLARLAAPSCVSVCLEWWWYELMILLCGLLPDPKPAVASMGVLIQTTALIYVFPSSLGFGVSARVGNELGANRPVQARMSAAVGIGFSVLMGFAALGFANGMKDHWGRMFTEDSEILRLTSIALPIVGLCELGNCPQTIGSGVLRGSARPAHAAQVNLGAFYLVGLPVAVGLGFGWDVGFRGLWMGLLAAQICCAGLMMFVVGSTNWDAQAQRAQLLTCGSETAVEKETFSICKLNDEDGEGEKEEVCYAPFIMIEMEKLGR